MAPWIPPSVIEFLQTIAPIASVATSIILAYLYFTQSQTLEEQRKLSRANQCPYLVGPYSINYDTDNDVMHLHVSNTGNGPAIGVELKSKLKLYYRNEDIVNEHIVKGGTTVIASTSENRGDTVHSNIQPRESDVQITIDASHIMVAITDKTRDYKGEDYRPIQDVLPVLREHGIGRASIDLYLEYTDQFGESENPFGREYISHGIKRGFDPDDIDFDGLKYHLSETFTPIDTR